MENRKSKMLLSLIGEQPIPNLLVIRHLRAQENLLVYTSNSNILRTARRLRTLLSGRDSLHNDLEVDAYNLESVFASLLQKLAGRQDVVINLTGGTKPMSIAAYMVAAQLNIPMIYLQSEESRSRLYRYEFRAGAPSLVADDVLPEVIGLDEYLSAHVTIQPPRQRAADDEGHRFERVIFDVLTKTVDEIKPGVNLHGAVEVDLAIRCKNQVGIVEVKLGSNHLKAAIDQLNTAGSQTYLGSYTRKFLVSDQDWSNYSDLFELAAAHRITVIQLPGYGRERLLNHAEADLLTASILKGLGAA